ncbi:MAG: hypothetical protein MJE77_36670 [Proteobacteria bacterium]|nr:hypothetical protein [Pseudomonadota bacterium]
MHIPIKIAVHRAVLVVLAIGQGAGISAAEPIRTARAPRVLHIPTAHLQPPRQVHVSAGGTHRGGAFAAISTGLGRLAEIDVEVSDRLAGCRQCAGDDRRADALVAASALFKVGLGENHLVQWQPALALGFRTTLGTRRVDDFDRLRVARLYAVASKTLSSLQLHVGFDIWDAAVRRDGQRRVLSNQPLSDRTRPFGGFAWTPSLYPRTSLIGDISWSPVVDENRVELRWLAGWGAYYQALDWASIELSVRHRQGQGLGDATVAIRVNASFPRSRARLHKGRQK